MAKLIRSLMSEHGMLGASGKPVEVDEAFIGGKRKQGDKDRKTPVMAAVEVGGHIRTAVVPRATAQHAVPFIEDNVFYGSNLHTDESFIYKGKKVKQYYKHKSVRHIWHEYVLVILCLIVLSVRDWSLIFIVADMWFPKPLTVPHS